MSCPTAAPSRCSAWCRSFWYPSATGSSGGLFTGFVNSLLQMLLGFYAPRARPAAFGGHDPAGLCAGLLLSGACLRVCQAVQKQAGRRGRGLRRRVRAAFPVQLFVRRADLGQPERWSAAWIYSLTYNGSYMLPEGIMTTIAVVLLYQGLRPSCSAANNLIFDPFFNLPVLPGVPFFTASQDFLFPFFLICPYLLHKSFTMADITFSAPPASRTARFLPCTSSCPFQLLTITEMHFCTVFSNVFLLQYFSKNAHFMLSLSISLFR